MDVDTPIHPRAAFYGELRRMAWQWLDLDPWSPSAMPYLSFDPDPSPKLCMCDACQRARFIKEGGRWHGSGDAAAPRGAVHKVASAKIPDHVHRIRRLEAPNGGLGSMNGTAYGGGGGGASGGSSGGAGGGGGGEYSYEPYAVTFRNDVNRWRIP